MADGKWISDLTAATPVADAARRVLTVRLEVVRDHLRSALHQAYEDSEHVHQLRVGTRRATAAVDIFGDCLPDRARRRARKTLRRLRRAAGQARDWDVFLLGLAEVPKPTARQQPGIDFVVGYSLAQRSASQSHLEEAGRGFPFAFERFMAETVAAARRPHGPAAPQTLSALAFPMLSGLLGELAQAAGRDPDDYEHLHRVRIIGKRLRYAMEVFADCFPAPFRERLYPAVEEMQDVLGVANDSHVAGQRLEAVRGQLQSVGRSGQARFRAGIDKLLRFHRQRLGRQTRLFVKWRGGWQELAGLWQELGLGPQRGGSAVDGRAPGPGIANGGAPVGGKVAGGGVDGVGGSVDGAGIPLPSSESTGATGAVSGGGGALSSPGCGPATPP